MKRKLIGRRLLPMRRYRHRCMNGGHEMSTAEWKALPLIYMRSVNYRGVYVGWQIPLFMCPNCRSHISTSSLRVVPKPRRKR